MRRLRCCSELCD